MKSVFHSSRRGSSLFLIIFLMVTLFVSLLAAVFVTSNTQVSIRRGQALHRSLADQARIKALLLALVADRFETAPASGDTRPLSLRLQEAVSSLQGGGSWSIVAQPTDSEYPSVTPFPRTPVPSALVVLDGESVDEGYLTPELHALIAPGTKVSATPALSYQFHRTADQAKDFHFSVRFLSFPLLHAPHIAETTLENRIVYWRASDLRRDVSELSQHPNPSARLALWSPEKRHFSFAVRSLADREGGVFVHDTVRSDISTSGEDDPSLLCRYGPSLGVLSDETTVSALPWLFRERAAIWVNAPAYIFSDTALKNYLNYCGRSHVFNLESPEASLLDGIEKQYDASAASIDLARVVDRTASDSPLYNPAYPVAVLFTEHDGDVTLTDSGGSSSLAPLTLIFAGSSDLTRTALHVRLSTPLARPVIIFLYHAELQTTIAATVNGALYCDPESSYAPSASADLAVASLIYYGGNEAKSKWNLVVANRPIPDTIESIAPRVILPVIKVEPL